MKNELKVKRVIRGRIYERTISDLSRITSNEAATMIGITLLTIVRGAHHIN